MSIEALGRLAEHERDPGRALKHWRTAVEIHRRADREAWAHTAEEAVARLEKNAVRARSRAH